MMRDGAELMCSSGAVEFGATAPLLQRNLPTAPEIALLAGNREYLVKQDTIHRLDIRHIRHNAIPQAQPLGRRP
jgi:hypothetical protein